MSRHQVITTLSIHACPKASTSTVESLLFGISPVWVNQSLIVGSYRTEVQLRMNSLQIEDLISHLIRIDGMYLDLVQQGSSAGVWFTLAPGLGLYRAEINSAGEIMLNEDRIKSAIEQSAGNHRELSRLLRILLGQAWDDLLEPFRAVKYSENVSLINRAV